MVLMAHYILTEDQTGIDQLALLIEFAVTGNSRESWDADKETPYFSNNYAMLRIIGKIQHIKTTNRHGGFVAINSKMVGKPVNHLQY